MFHPCGCNSLTRWQSCWKTPGLRGGRRLGRRVPSDQVDRVLPCRRLGEEDRDVHRVDGHQAPDHIAALALAPIPPSVTAPRTEKSARRSRSIPKPRAYQRSPGYFVFGRPTKGTVLRGLSPVKRRRDPCRGQSMKDSPLRPPSDRHRNRPWAPSPHTLRSRDHADPGGGEFPVESWLEHEHHQHQHTTASRCCCCSSWECCCCGWPRGSCSRCC